jgi:hypothetical protein
MQAASLEKRRSVRHPVDKDMQVILEGRALQVRLVNVCDRGAGMLVDAGSIDPDKHHVMILRCEVAGEIIDVSLQIRHYHHIQDRLYVGAEVVADLTQSLTEYIRHHQNLDSSPTVLDPSLGRHFLDQVKAQTDDVFSKPKSHVIDKETALESLSDHEWVSYIGLSSQIMTTRIYLSYRVDAARKFSRLPDDAENSKVHDFMREKTNVIAGKIKRWVLSHQDVDDATCGNFRVRMPCTEQLDGEIFSVIQSAEHGMVWETRHSTGEGDFVCCAFLQIEDPVKASYFLKLLTQSQILEPEEDDAIEFL